MTDDTVSLYPKTSCPCGDCKGQYPYATKGDRTNLSVRNCDISPYFDCYDRAVLGTVEEPVDKVGIYELNPQAYRNKMAPNFGKVPCKIAGCPQPGYLSMDPRLFSPTRADYLTLDRPPMDGNVPLKDVYDKRFDSYGCGFTPYEYIGDGQIVYYIDKSIEDAFYKPVYSEPAEETSIIYKDPMDSMKPEYNRKALVNTENPTVTTPYSYPYCLSSIQDSQSFREDIIALQQRKHNQEKWSARWTGNGSLP